MESDAAHEDGDLQVLGSHVLDRRCALVENFGEQTARLGAHLLASLSRCTDGIGLAANQVGVGLRAFAYDLRPVGGQARGVWFNPELVDHGGSETAVEGCLSIPGLYWPVTRPGRVTVRGQDELGEEVVAELEGLPARLFQHEMDHLDGVLVLDRVGEDERAALSDELVRLGWVWSGRHWHRPRRRNDGPQRLAPEPGPSGGVVRRDPR